MAAAAAATALKNSSSSSSSRAQSNSTVVMDYSQLLQQMNTILSSMGLVSLFNGCVRFVLAGSPCGRRSAWFVRVCPALHTLQCAGCCGLQTRCEGLAVVEQWLGRCVKLIRGANGCLSIIGALHGEWARVFWVHCIRRRAARVMSDRPHLTWAARRVVRAVVPAITCYF
jgi:hypothetical protein